MSESQAIRIARRMHGHPRQPVHALLASLTVPGTIPPPGSKEAFSTIENAPTWVVTFDLPKPINGAVGCASPGTTCPKVMVSHLIFVLDAVNGRFVRGFETK